MLLSGFWNNNHFSNNQTILGSYGNPYSCLLYGGISQCIGFSQFILTNPSIYLPNENYKFNSAYAVPAINTSNNQDLYNYGASLFSVEVYKWYGDAENTYGLFYTNVTNQTKYANPVQGYFYPNYEFYNASISLNKYFNYSNGAVIQINADFGYYIPIYQVTNLNTPNPVIQCNNNNPSSILQMIENAESSICEEAVEDNLTFAVSTQAIQVNIPNNIYYWLMYNFSNTNNNTIFYLYEKWDNINNGYNNTIINHQGSVIMKTHNSNLIYLYPLIPSSASQYNIFAFYDISTGEIGPIPNSIPPGPIVNN